MSSIDYKSAGVNIDAGNEAVERIKDSVKSTFNKNVLTGIGSFGSLFDLKSVVSEYKNPVLVQSIDGVGTKTIIARKMNKFNTIGIDLVSACCNDITVMGARPLTFLDYIANDRLKPEIVEEFVRGIAKACKENDIALVGGETAEMPDTYLKGEHDVVGVVTGIVDKDQIIDGSKIQHGNIVLGIPSTGLQTNGYSLARKLFFEVGGYSVNDKAEGLEKTVGETLLEPSSIYNPFIQKLLENDVQLNGMAHISGGGLVENIPRITPKNCGVKLQEGSWPIPPVFKVMQNIGKIPFSEMYRTFNMGIGLTLVVSSSEVEQIQKLLNGAVPVYKIGEIVKGSREVMFS